MTAAESAALARIKGYASANRIVIQSHALKRMRDRHAGYEDVRRALMTATFCKDQRGDATRRADWKVRGGSDLDGDELACAVNIEGATVVITIF